MKLIRVTRNVFIILVAFFITIINFGSRSEVLYIISKNHIIFSENQVKSFYPKILTFGIHGPYWTPSESEAILSYTYLKKFLSKSKNINKTDIFGNIDQYYIQYIGFTENEERFIFVNGICKKFADKSNNWRKSFLTFFDGGNCYFNAQFEIKSNSIVRASINIS